MNIINKKYKYKCKKYIYKLKLYQYGGNDAYDTFVNKINQLTGNTKENIETVVKLFMEYYNNGYDKIKFPNSASNIIDQMLDHASLVDPDKIDYNDAVKPIMYKIFEKIHEIKEDKSKRFPNIYGLYSNIVNMELSISRLLYKNPKYTDDIYDYYMEQEKLYLKQTSYQQEILNSFITSSGQSMQLPAHLSVYTHPNKSNGNQQDSTHRTDKFNELKKNILKQHHVQQV